MRAPAFAIFLTSATLAFAGSATSLAGCGSSGGDNQQQEPGAGPGADGGVGAGGDGMANGDGGVASLFSDRLCTADFCWEVPKPQGNSLSGIFFTSEARGWAVGEGGAILRRDESGWRAASAPKPKNLHGVWAAADDDAWAVGDDGLIVHFNGTSLDVVPSGTTESLSGVWGAAKDNIWAVGSAGSILRWNGATWSVAGNAADEMHAVWGSGPDDVWAVGGTLNIGTTSHWDGAVWTTDHSSLSGSGFYGIAGTGKDDVWAVGMYGRISHKTTSGWTTQAILDSATEPQLVALTALAPNDVWVSSQSSTYHYDGNAWATVDGKRGAMATGAAPGSKTVWGADVAGGVRQLAPTAKEELPAANLTATWVHDDRDAYALTSAGALLHFDGAAWSPVGNVPGAYYSVGLGGTSDGKAIIAGSNAGSPGVVQIYDGTLHALPALPSEASSGFYAPIVGGSSANDVWVGSGSTGIVSLFHYDGAWKTVPQPSPSGAAIPRLTTLHVAGAKDTWVMGQVDVTVTRATDVVNVTTAFWGRFDGTSWTTGLLPDAGNVAIDTVWAASSDDVWAAGVFRDLDKPKDTGFVYYPSDTVVYRLRGGAWTRQALQSAGAQYNGPEHAFLAGNGQRVWLGIEGGAAVPDNMLSFDGKAWSPRPCPATPGALWVTAGATWVLGGSYDRRGLLKTR